MITAIISRKTKQFARNMIYLTVRWYTVKVKSTYCVITFFTKKINFMLKTTLNDMNYTGMNHN